MRLIEQMAAPEGRAHRQRVFFRKMRQAIASLLRPAAAAKEHDRRARTAEQFGKFLHFRGVRRRIDRRERRRIGNRDALD